jgi:hypothetical protein
MPVLEKVSSEVMRCRQRSNDRWLWLVLITKITDRVARQSAGDYDGSSSDGDSSSARKATMFWRMSGSSSSAN